MSEDLYGPFADMIPDGAFPTCGFRLLSYMNPEGETCYRLDYEGEIAVSQLIGLIEMARHDVTAAAIGAARRQSDDG